MPDKDIIVTPVFEANYHAYDSHNYRVIANEGSSRSSKTYSEIQLLTTIAGRFKKQISVCSPSLVHLKKGARKDFLEILDQWGLFNEDDFNRTDNLYHFPTTGSYIEFFGADEPGRLRGPGRDILLINEANLIGQDSYIQLAMRTTETIFIDYNPADIESYVYGLADGKDNKKIHSTYKNNLENLSDFQVKEIENLKNIDKNLWDVFGLGKRGTSSETIYTHLKMCDRLPLKGMLFAGTDFGYNVETGVVLCEYYEGAVYVDELLYETKLTTGDLIERYKGMIEISKTMEIYCDNAEPKTIEELIRAGFNAMPADKDVTEGIRKVKSLQIFITKRSTNLWKEAKSYKWKVDKDGRVLDEPVKFRDHLMDAMRYAIFTKLHTLVQWWGTLR